MTPAEKAALVTRLIQAAFALAAAGVRHRFPGVSPREQDLRLAEVTLGPALTRQVFADAHEVLGP